MTPVGFEPETLGFVTQHLKYCATEVPRNLRYYPEICLLTEENPGKHAM
jgi:hypothetical protein